MEFQIKGVEGLSEEEKMTINEILSDSYEKIKRRTKTDFIFKIAIKTGSKQADKKDKRKHYSIQLGISGATRSFEASSDEWDLRKALHKAVVKLENEVEHAFHASEQK